MNRQQILSRLARIHAVLYSNGPWSVWDTSHSRFRGSRWFGRFEHRDGVLVDRPPKLLLRWPTWPVLDRAPMWLSVARWRHALSTMGGGPVVAYVFHPMYRRHAEVLRPDLLVYNPYDMFSRTPSWSAAQAEEERQLLHHSDLVIAASEPTRAALQAQTGRPVYCVTNAADAEQFARGARQPAPADIAAIPRPRIGYVGSLNRKVDFGLLARLARREPGWHFVFIGPQGSFDDESRAAFDDCIRLPNIHVLPARPVTELPMCMGALDVGLMCYRKDTWMDFAFPLKLYEYLAAGLPVISTPLPSLLEHGEFIDLVEGEAAWHGAISAALAGKGPSTPDGRRQEARRNTWDARVATIAELIDHALRGTLAVPPAPTLGLNVG